MFQDKVVILEYDYLAEWTNSHLSLYFRRKSQCIAPEGPVILVPSYNIDK